MQGGDIYHPSVRDLTGTEISFCGAIAYSIKKDNYLILETEAQGMHGWLTYPGQLRLQAFSHLASDANSVDQSDETHTFSYHDGQSSTATLLLQGAATQIPESFCRTVIRLCLPDGTLLL